MTSIIQYNVDTIQKIVENFDYNLSENISSEIMMSVSSYSE